MSLLAHAIATHPDAPPAALTAVVDQTLAGITNDNANEAHRLLAATVLAHPNTPPQAATNAAIAQIRATTLAVGLTSPLLTATGQARLLATARAVALLGYLEAYADAHPDIHTALIAHLDQMDHRKARTQGTLDLISAQYVTVMTHPTVAPRAHLAAVRYLAGLPAAPLYRTLGEQLDMFITHATRHPAHLRKLAATLTTNGQPGLAGELTAYAALADTGADPHAAHLATFVNRARVANTPDLWCRAIEASHDPDIALEALRAHPYNTRVLRTIRDTGALAGSPASHYATAHDAGGDHDLHDLTNLDTTRTYTRLDALAHRAAARTAIFAELLYLSHLGPQAPGATVDAAATALTPYLDPASTLTGAHRSAAEHLAAHPNIGHALRDTLLNVLATRSDDPTHAMLVAVASATDQTNALLDQPVPLTTRATWCNPTMTAHLTHRLHPALTAHLNDPATLGAALALEPEFTGTLRELLNTATTITI